MFMGKAADSWSTWSSQEIILSSSIFVSFAITSLYSNYIFLIVWRREYFPCSLRWPSVGGRMAGDIDANRWTWRRQTSVCACESRETSQREPVWRQSTFSVQSITCQGLCCLKPPPRYISAYATLKSALFRFTYKNLRRLESNIACSICHRETVTN